MVIALPVAWLTSMAWLCHNAANSGLGSTLPIAYPVSTIPPDIPQDHITLKIAPLDVCMHPLLLLKTSV